MSFVDVVSCTTHVPALLKPSDTIFERDHAGLSSVYGSWFATGILDMPFNSSIA
jgi:hypothetical protein